jgi:hypothetical protein
VKATRGLSDGTIKIEHIVGGGRRSLGRGLLVSLPRLRGRAGEGK